MEVLLVLVLIAAIWWFVKGRSSSTAAPPVSQPRRPAPAPVPTPTIEVKFSTSVGSGHKRPDVAQDVGPLTQVSSDTWVLNPRSPLPLTLIGADEALATQVKTILGKAEYWGQRVPELALLVAQHNLCFKEVDEFVAQLRPRYDAAFQRRVKASSEWPTATEKDREDLRTEFEEAAIEELGVSIGDADMATLLGGQPSGFKEDDELLRRFAGDSALYTFFLGQRGRANPVVTVKADEPGRKPWEQLVTLGLALRGKDIPTQELLAGLRLKDLNDLLEGTIEKPLGRKAKALEAVLALPDLHDRLSQRIAFRETFRVNPPVGLDVDTLCACFSYASDVAVVVHQTYFTGVKTLQSVEQQKQDPGFYKAWEIHNWEDPLPACAKPYCKKYASLPGKKPPFHVGCRCELDVSFKD